MNEEAKPFDHAAALRGQVEAALQEFPPHVVRWAWEAFFVNILPFARTIMDEQILIEQAKACGLSIDEAMEASAMVAAAKSAHQNPHALWMLVETMQRFVPDGATRTAIAAQLVNPEKPNGISQ